MEREEYSSRGGAQREAGRIKHSDPLYLLRSGMQERKLLSNNTSKY